MAAARQPLQFSLQTLILITIVVASALAVGRDFFIALQEDPTDHRSFAPMVGSLALAWLYRRPDLGDLLFVHILLPALALLVIAIVALPSIVGRQHQLFWREFSLFAYWLLYAACLIGAGVGLAYWVWLWISGAIRLPPDGDPAQ
jgi:hypothetical protein